MIEPKISRKKLQITFLIAFGGLLAALVLLSFGQQAAGLLAAVVAMGGVTGMMLAGQCPHCRNVRSAKWINPFPSEKELFCGRCGKKIEIEEDGWFRPKKKGST